MTNLTVYDLMGEDHEIQARIHVSNKRRVWVRILNEQSEEVYSEESHIYAWESLVGFAKQVLACDERLRQEIEINE